MQRQRSYALGIAVFAATVAALGWWAWGAHEATDAPPEELARSTGPEAAADHPSSQAGRASSGSLGRADAESSGRVVMPRGPLIDPPSLYIRGSVSDAGGAPAIGAQVEASGGKFRFEDLVGEDGQFAVGPLFPGLYTLRARSNGLDGLARPVDVHAGDSNVTLRFRAAAEVYGVIRDGVTGDGVSLNFTIHLEDHASRTWPGFSAADGTFELHPLLPGKFSLFAIERFEGQRSGDSPPLVSRFDSDEAPRPVRIAALDGPILLQEGQIVRDVVLVLRPGAYVQIEFEGFGVADEPLQANFLRNGALVGGGGARIPSSVFGLIGSVPNFTQEFLVAAGDLRLELTSAAHPRPILREFSLHTGETQHVLVRKSEFPAVEPPQPEAGPEAAPGLPRGEPGSGR